MKTKIKVKKFRGIIALIDKILKILLVLIDTADNDEQKEKLKKAYDALVKVQVIINNLLVLF